MQLKWCLTLLATVLLAGSSANASLVIDDFTSGVTILGTGSDGYALSDDVPGNVTFTMANVGLGSSFQTGGGGLTATFLNTSLDNQLTINYALGTAVDLHSSGAFPGSPLVLDLFDTLVGTFELDVTYSGAAGSASINDIAITSSEKVGLDGGLFGNGAVASAVDTITLAFRATSLETIGPDTFARFANPSASIAAVPEPTTMALLTPLMLGGVFYRRRKAKEADQAKI